MKRAGLRRYCSGFCLELRCEGAMIIWFFVFIFRLWYKLQVEALKIVEFSGFGALQLLEWGEWKIYEKSC